MPPESFYVFGKTAPTSGNISQRSEKNPYVRENSGEFSCGKRLLKGSGLGKVHGEAVWPFTAATQQKHENAMCTHGRFVVRQLFVWGLKEC